MKIALLTNGTSGGGAAVAAYRMFKALRKKGVKVDLFTPQAHVQEPGIIELLSPGQAKSFNRLKHLRYAFFKKFFQRSSFTAEYSPARKGLGIPWAERLSTYDVIFLHWINLGFLSMQAIEELHALGKPIVWHLHDLWAITGGCHYPGTCHRYVDKCFNCPALVFQGDNDRSKEIWKLKRELAQEYKTTFVGASRWIANIATGASVSRKSGRVLAIPNPIDIDKYLPGNKQQARKKLQVPEDSFILLFTAANIHDKRKGFELLYRALKICNEKGYLPKKTRLVIAGKSKNDYSSFPYSPISLGLIESEEEMVSLYQSADVFVIPSLQDNLPNTVVEALACGTPVCGFKTGGIPELVIQNETGVLSVSTEASNLARALRDIAESDLAKMGENARKLIVDNYSELVVATQYETLFQELKG